MSTNYLRLIPSQPDYLPTATNTRDALDLLKCAFPNAIHVLGILTEGVQFVDQGGNFEEVICPSCAAVLDLHWWQRAMDHAWDQGGERFADLGVQLPCCKNQSSLNDLRYVWPAGFARFQLEVAEPEADIDRPTLAALERILGCTLRTIRTHY